MVTRNAAELGLRDVTVRRDTVERVLAGPRAGQPFNVTLVDPPYDLSEEALAAVLARLVEGDWLAADAIVVVERSSRSPEPTWPQGLVALDEKRYGETVVWYAERG